jgi:hypothetical protein
VDLAATASAQGYDAIGIADLNTLAGVVRIHAEGRKAALRPLIGARIVLLSGEAFLAYPVDRAAYGRLSRLISKGRRHDAEGNWQEKGRCDLTLDDLAAAQEGLQLIALLTDQRGEERVQDGRCDIGSVESQAPTAVTLASLQTDSASPTSGWGWLAAGFALLAGLSAAFSLSDGATLAASLLGALWLVALGAAAIALFCGFAKLVARSSIYTITSRRIVMHVGVALPMTINFPYKAIESAALATHSDGSGSIPIALTEGNKAAYMVVWPHARPWRFSKVEPMLRCIPDARNVAKILADALVAAKSAELAETEKAYLPTAQQPASHKPVSQPARELSTAAA